MSLHLEEKPTATWALRRAGLGWRTIAGVRVVVSTAGAS